MPFTSVEFRVLIRVLSRGTRVSTKGGHAHFTFHIFLLFEMHNRSIILGGIHRESKRRLRTPVHIFTKYSPILKILSPIQSLGNLQ